MALNRKFKTKFAKHTDYLAIGHKNVKETKKG